jgi:hypothetical protein
MGEKETTIMEWDRIETDIYVTEAKIKDDVEKHKKYRIGKEWDQSKLNA